jgi:UDP-2,3-diacylglucosamine hydrolase
MSLAPVGIIAGEGIFPVLIARGARKQGRKVVCAAFAGHGWASLKDEVDVFGWVGVLKLSQWIRLLKDNGCSEAILVGRVAKGAAYDRWSLLRYIPDWRTVKVLWRVMRHDKRPQTWLDAIATELSKAGIQLIDQTTFTPEQLSTEGVMTRRQPSAAQWIDIRYGYERAIQISRMDIGQAMALRDKDVLAVEATEGTNAMIERAGKLCKVGGWTLIKVSNTNADLRVDVPTIGTTTIEKLAAARAGCVVLEPGKTVILEKEKVLELADKYKIAVVGYGGEK